MKLQLKYRRRVIGQFHSNKLLFTFYISRNGKALSLLELKENLYQLLDCSTTRSEVSGNSLPNDKKSLSLDLVLVNPELLIGQRIKHRFDIEGELVWCDGQVIKFNNQTMEFEVIYDKDDGSFCHTLMDDIENGDVLLV